MPLSMILMILLKRQEESKLLEYVGIFLVVSMMIISIVGVYVDSFNELWHVAFLSRSATEIFVSEIILIGVRSLFNA